MSIDARQVKLNALSTSNTAIAVNDTMEDVAGKAQGQIAILQAANIYFDANNFTGDGSSVNKLKVNTAAITTYLQSLPGFVGDGTVSLRGNMTWVDTGQLSVPVVTFGTTASNSIVVNWTSITNATGYTVKRNTSNTQSGATTIYTGALLTFTDTGVSPSTTYYYFVIATASGYLSSGAGTATTSTPAGAIALTLAANNGTFTESPATHWTGAGAQVVWSPTLNTGTNGIYFIHLINMTTSNQNVIGLHPGSTPSGFSGFTAGMYLNGSVLNPVGGGTGTSGTITAGTYIGIKVVGSVITGVKSSDGVTWTDWYAYTATRTTTLYLKAELAGGSVIDEPKFLSL